jgi:probable HAF family extracellular repeat protein
MKKTCLLSFVLLGLVLTASTTFAQMYTMTDLGTLHPDPDVCIGSVLYVTTGINASGQIVGANRFGHYPCYGFRTAPNSLIDPATDDLGTLGGSYTDTSGINSLGQAVGWSWLYDGGYRAFRTAPNSPINPATDNLGTLSATESGWSTWSEAGGINDLGQVVGTSDSHAFRTAPNSPINPATDDLGTLGGSSSFAGGSFFPAGGINNLGQVVGSSYLAGDNAPVHAFRTAPNSAINAFTDDLGTLGGTSSYGTAINAFGQAVGYSSVAGDSAMHAFRTAPNRPIDPATDDLGTLNGYPWSYAYGIDTFGQVVGESGGHAFLHSVGVMSDLNNLIQAGSRCEVTEGIGINDAGQIAANAVCSGIRHAVRLDPIYKGYVQRPISADDSSAFSAKRGVVPVKFVVMQYGTQQSCALPATISIVRTSSDALSSADESTYAMNADDGSNFRIDSCQYIYNLAVSSLGVGTYRVDISINGTMVGHAVFALN